MVFCPGYAFYSCNVDLLWVPDCSSVIETSALECDNIYFFFFFLLERQREREKGWLGKKHPHGLTQVQPTETEPVGAEVKECRI